jgi:Predicted tagatose 6-phosphate kinase
MKKEHPLKNIVGLDNTYKRRGICSICSANEFVIKAAMRNACKKGEYVLIEATANQVNQYGGYTGMQPADFSDFVYSLAKEEGFPNDKLLLGGDHLGPLVWKNEKSENAMGKAVELIESYVAAGFTKIHIDTSMRLGDDSNDAALDDNVIAQRGAVLCKAAEKAYDVLTSKESNCFHPVYVIGSEVPIPGGTQDNEELRVTRPSDFINTVRHFKEAFMELGLEHTWENVIAVVVQPGVEFGDSTIHEYNHVNAEYLCNSLKEFPGLVFEGHSTDYQTRDSLKEMVCDGIAILKVGPALTYSLREALFLLNHMEYELFGSRQGFKLSNFTETLEKAMLENPENWEKYYHGSEEEKSFARKYSLSDRCRYYLSVPSVKESISTLLFNLKNVDLNLSLLSQYFPVQYHKIREGKLKKDPEELLIDKVMETIADYDYAIYSEVTPLPAVI